MQIIYKKLEELIPYANNAKKHDDVSAIKNSIKEFGFRQPIVIDNDREWNNKLDAMASEAMGLTIEEYRELQTLETDDAINKFMEEHSKA